MLLYQSFSKLSTVLRSNNAVLYRAFPLSLRVTGNNHQRVELMLPSHGKARHVVTLHHVVTQSKIHGAIACPYPTKLSAFTRLLEKVQEESPIDAPWGNGVMGLYHDFIQPKYQLLIIPLLEKIQEGSPIDPRSTIISTK